jgi:hypothetical protein
MMNSRTAFYLAKKYCMKAAKAHNFPTHGSNCCRSRNG